ncbi:Flavin-dependent oxidoreductase, luciferase family (includes alkanesulfonate monooxygenase SsuD and methylene tetrahydromethanopterin reductase) [Pseudomonas flavescens]|uniref:Flavin-dependent oxidoreductase, luciferase family (Includes alkanesulfonate monooxygenase SsuD and methylene tetrahydromethanopterin reductase) n=1 Tax=Phytopseudomonas flavescens TaxID=29435 RepID=A0A1G7Z5Z4_9GAMM|nr:LLM class flavin-dependent oxidoreductase [Pseudomonas flavescens]SDH04172.1 Flavin-dependent oxidoreductase, luciferase family (includes alkanesulfonate monooxygenase SsuD and methylene tetrahydromethanopterin reductase) [Pseudomonas flavescens]
MTSPARQQRPFKLGFLTHAFGTDPRQAYRDLIEQFEVAEALGFDGGWIAQHHLSGGFGQLPSPLVLLSAIAARTRHIELGTGVIVLPLEDTLRLAEDAAVLDQLSEGRVQLGLGSGGANLGVFEAFGRDPDRRQDDFQQGIQQLQQALAGTPLAGSASLQPPGEALSQRLWHSHGSPQGAVHAAQQGNGLLLGTATHDPLTVQKPLADAYLNAWQHNHRAPRIGVVRAVFPAADRQSAQAELAADIELHVPRLIREGLIDEAANLEQHLQLLNVHHGHPEEIIRSLRGDPSLLPYADYFIAVVQSESSTQAQVLRRLESIARDIAPALGWTPANADKAAVRARIAQE